MTRPSFTGDYTRQYVKGVFICKANASREECRQLVQDLGCKVITENTNSLTIQASRGRLKELKARYMANEDDKSNISSRLKGHFDRILIGGSAR